ncbi:MAG: Dabb family protein [Oscillospiraceae bacterium]|jgi:hypothetical protein|nr:Dabb family protein [Oscillospiraceae bacterium]
MVKHIILWDFPEGLPHGEQARRGALIKAALEGLVGVIPGLLRLRVSTELLGSSNAQLVLESEFESPQALADYTVHPAHQKAAAELVRPNVCNRRCADFEV